MCKSVISGQSRKGKSETGRARRKSQPPINTIDALYMKSRNRTAARKLHIEESKVRGWKQ